MITSLYHLPRLYHHTWRGDVRGAGWIPAVEQMFTWSANIFPVFGCCGTLAPFDIQDTGNPSVRSELCMWLLNVYLFTYMSVTSLDRTRVSCKWKLHCCQAPLPWWPSRCGPDQDTLARLIPITLCTPSGGFTGTGMGWQLLQIQFKPRLDGDSYLSRRWDSRKLNRGGICLEMLTNSLGDSSWASFCLLL